MPLITWNDFIYSVQNETIDNQHKQLVGMINELNEALSSRQGYGITNSILEKAVKYTVFHFQTEENLMEEFSFPGAAEHKAQHQAFIKKVTTLKREHNQQIGTVPHELLNYLRDWLLRHVVHTDKELGLFLLNQAQK